MLLKLDPTAEVPLFRQIAAAVRRAVREEAVSEGDRLPAARDLAASLGVNMHTVLRAYGMLRDEGLIELRPGRGAVVRQGVGTDAVLRHLAAELVRVAKDLGMDAAELTEMVRREFT